jgi:hypothetical protein
VSAGLARCAADPPAYAAAAADGLAAALGAGDIGQVIAIRSEAETVRGRAAALARDMQLAAAEVCRRAERCIGLLLRAGQQAGQVRRPGMRPPTRSGYDRVRSNGTWEHVAPDGHGARHTPSGAPGATSASPLAWVSKDDLSARAGIYQLTDGVTDATFEAALGLARAEGRLTRANLVRRIRQQQKQGDPQ